MRGQPAHLPPRRPGSSPVCRCAPDSGAPRLAGRHRCPPIIPAEGRRHKVGTTARRHGSRPAASPPRLPARSLPIRGFAMAGRGAGTGPRARRPRGAGQAFCRVRLKWSITAATMMIEPIAVCCQEGIDPQQVQAVANRDDEQHNRRPSPRCCPCRRSGRRRRLPRRRSRRASRVRERRIGRVEPGAHQNAGKTGRGATDRERDELRAHDGDADQPRRSLVAPTA